MRLAFIGGGRMAEAMIAGVLSKGIVDHGDISVGEMIGRALPDPPGALQHLGHHKQC